MRNGKGRRIHIVLASFDEPAANRCRVWVCGRHSMAAWSSLTITTAQANSGCSPWAPLAYKKGHKRRLLPIIALCSVPLARARRGEYNSARPGSSEGQVADAL